MSETQLSKGVLGWSLTATFFIAALIAIVLFYIDQDQRGASDLAAAEARWKAAGYSLKASDYYPPPVPDTQNLAALPIFKLDPDPYDPTQLTTRRLKDAADSDKHGGDLFDYEPAGQPRLNLAALVAKAYAKQFPGKKPPASSLAQLEELYPFLSDLRAAAPTHPIFRLNLKYDHQPPWDRSFGAITEQIALSKLLAYDAKLALDDNQPQVAVDDFKVAFELARGTGTDPSLIGGLVEIGLCAITRGTFVDSLAKHPWNDAQLAAIQAELKRFDLLSVYQFDMKSQLVVGSLPMFQWSKERSTVMSAVLSMTAGGTSPPKENFLAWLLWQMWARGWWDMNAAQTADLLLNASQCADPKAQLVDPKRLALLETDVATTKEHIRPWNILYAVAMGPMAHALVKFSQAQVQLDEDRIVCALERYRLAHGSYPPNLAALVPACLDDLPHDIMTGAPYHYRLNPDGTFLLYSVGWNQTDDGGKFGENAGNPKIIDYEKGDWPWPVYKR